MTMHCKNFGFRNLKDVKDALGNVPDIRFLRFMTADMNGERPCGFTIPVSELGGRIREDGTLEMDRSERNSVLKGFDASSLYPERINESDKNASLDFSTARVLPWNYSTNVAGFERTWREMVVFGDIMDPRNGPYKFDSRSVLKGTLKRMRDLGIADTVYIGPELEFFLFQADETGFPVMEEFFIDDSMYLRPKPVDKGRYFKGGRYGEVRKEAQIILQEMGYRSEYDHHEVSESQHEIDLHYLPALEMADLVILYRYIIKKVARSYGLFASFMPKPIAGINGTGMHTHQSLFKKGKNIFFDEGADGNLSLSCRRYIAGLMDFVPEITAVLNPWVNSYKRMVPGFEAPAYICFDMENRSSLIRIPGYDMEDPHGIRVELRNPDPSCNPYIAFSLEIMAGISGIIEKMDPPALKDINVFELSEEEMREMDIRRLPPDLESSLELFRSSELAKNTLGIDLHAHYLKAKEAHLEKYYHSLGHRKDDRSMRINVSRYEMEELLPVL